MVRKSETSGRLDDAARAGWLYYVAGRTQDEIAASMGISRQSAQRLVSLAVAERLIKVRLDHPIAACLELANAVRKKFHLKHVEVVPSDPGSSSTTVGIARGSCGRNRALAEAAGSDRAGGRDRRTLKAAVDQLPAIECPQHRIVSLTGNIAPDGSAAYYNVIFSMADAVKARHFPMPLPVLVTSAEERKPLHSQQLVRSTLEISAQADVTFVGIGELGIDGPLCVDGFLEKDEMMELMRNGAVGEICGWVFDGEGKLLDNPINERVASASIPSRERVDRHWNRARASANSRRSRLPLYWPSDQCA